jgi:hypothetical protein
MVETIDNLVERVVDLSKDTIAPTCYVTFQKYDGGKESTIMYGNPPPGPQNCCIYG